MGLEREISHKFKVIGPYKFVLKGGHYYLEQDCPNEVETTCVKMDWLIHFCELIAAGHACNGEATGIVLQEQIMAVADALYDRYEHFFANGVNICEYADYYMEKTREKYLARPIVCGQFNCSESEQTVGLPEGWWWDFGGVASKYFQLWKVTVDFDSFVRVGFYLHDDSSNMNAVDWIDITERGDYTVLFKKYSAIASELVRVCEFVFEQCDPKI